MGAIYCISPGETALWIGAKNGIYEAPYSGGCRRVEGLALSAPDRIWADTTDGAVWLFKGAQIYRWSEGRLRSFVLDSAPYVIGQGGASNGRLTCFWSAYHIYQWRDGQLHRLPFDIPEGIISGYIDREGLLWIGTNARGIRKIPLDRYSFPSFAAGLSLNRSPAPDASGQLWLSSVNRHLPDFRLFDWNTDRLKQAFAPAFNVNYLIRSQDGTFWFTTSGRQLCHTGRPGAAPVCDTLPPGNYTDLQEDHRGRPFLGYEGNVLYFFNPGERKWTAHSFAALIEDGVSAEIKAMAVDKTGRIWIGTAAGLLLATPRRTGDTYDFQRFTMHGPGPVQLTHNHVLALLPDPSDPDVCWAGTAGGLNRIDLRRGECRRLTASAGLANAYVCSILPADRQHIWFATYYGLYELNTQTFQWRHFTTADGLPANEFNHRAALRLPDGRLFFGGVNGFTVFDPRDLRRQAAAAPRLALTGLYIGNKKITPRDSTGILQTALPFTRSLALAHNEDDIQLRFALFDYFQPAFNRYYYRLRGLHDDWYDNGRVGQATYFNVPPGDYVFEVRAQNIDGIFSETLPLKVTVGHPWWQSAWAYFIYVLFLVALAMIFGFIRLERMRMARRLQAEQYEAERLKELEQFKSRLFSNYTHEFRTPLAIISGLAEQLSRQVKGATRNLVDGILRQTEDMLRTTGQILDLVKLEENRLVLQPEPVDLSAWLAQLGPGLEALAAGKNIHYSCTLPGQPLWAMLDIARLRDILVNLVSNAVKFSPVGGSVSLVLEQPAGHLLEIAVRDTGIGIAPEHLDKIFDRHYQVVHANVRPTGVGIGLSYAAELARAMGGRIDVASKPGEGSVFTLILPLETAPASPARTFPEMHSQYEPKIATSWVDDNPAYYGRPLVLIIEDNIHIARILAGFIADHYNTAFAMNGRTGLEQALEAVPDIIICDLRMPEMDGIAFCQALRSNPQTSHIPVIALTAFTDETERIRAMQAGANAWIAKPVSPEVLRWQINNFLHLRAQLQLHILQPAMVPAPATMPEFQKEKDFLQQMLAVIAKRYDDPDFTVAELQQVLNLSKSQLHRKLVSVSGQTAVWFIRKYRLDEAKKLLLTRRHMSVAEVAYRVGFSDPNYFSRAFSTEFGQSPSALREQEE